MKKYGQSILNTLLQIMPEVRDLRTMMIKNKDYVNPVLAKKLFTIWRTGHSVNNDSKTYLRPTTLSFSEIEQLQKEGLLRYMGDKIEITSKGSEIIKVMILGDDRSSFQNKQAIVDYNSALAKSKHASKTKTSKVASSWWSRFNNENSNG